MTPVPASLSSLPAAASAAADPPATQVRLLSLLLAISDAAGSAHVGDSDAMSKLE